ncbi:hypothetical protein [Pseudonocardia sp. TRM90224]|uniref:hypothetical protein n=1 Tax=Pseudonocardia sp. TRM90224 TaxID=2812678 RepID=UPI001E576E83|nr:hypothetical protein [Pseudonocardia sp. TRM90224]
MIGRRRFLTALGALTVAGTGAVTWRAVDQGVFAAGTGGAFTAWDEWNPPGDDVMHLVRAAVLAPSAHNTQPWLFRLAPDRIDVVPDAARNIGTLDPLRRELHISLGCALENLVLAAEHRGRAPRVEGWTVHLGRSTPRTSALFEAIPHRHTDRAAYAERPVEPATLDELVAAADGPVRLDWLDPARFAELTVRATRAIIDDPEQARDDYAWYRNDWDELQARKDGTAVDTAGRSAAIRSVAKILPGSHDVYNDYWFRSTKDVQLPTAAAIGALVVADPLDPLQRVAAGRAWQRLHLLATTKGLAMQPMNQIEERVDREHAAGLPPEFTAAMAELVPRGHAVFTFRIGHPTTDPLRSPRRRAEDVIIQ